MTTLRIIPDKDSFAHAERELERLAGKSVNLPSLLTNIGDALVINTKKRFHAKQGPDGKAWAPHAPLSLKLGARPDSLLRGSGRLFGSVNRNVSGSTLHVGANAPPYDRAQQFGAIIKPKKGGFLRVPIPAKRGGRGAPGFMFLKKITIPPRPYIGFGPRDEAATLNEINAWLAIEGNPKK